MLKRTFTTPRSAIAPAVVALALLAVGAAWLLTLARSRPSRPSPASAVVPQTPSPDDSSLWASVAGEEDPGAAVDSPPPVQPPATAPDGGRK